MKLRHILCLVVFCLTFVATASAQLKIGPRGGVTLAIVNSNAENTDLDYILGFSSGVVLEIGISDLFAIQPELMFNRRGYRTSAEEADFLTLLNYLDVSTLAKIRLGSAQGAQFFILIGPSFGYAINGTSKSEIGSIEESEDIDFEKAQLSQIDLRGTGGIGINLPITIGQLFIDARYDYGFLNIVDTTDPTNDSEVTNQGFNVGVGVLIALK